MAPRTVIEPPSGLRLPNPRVLWSFRDLLATLVWRDVRVRYKQAFFGMAWALIQPLALMAVFAVFLGALAKIPSGETSYALHVYSGLVPWALFAGTLGGAAGSVVGAESLVTRVYFPRLLLPLTPVGVATVDFAIAIPLVVGMGLLTGEQPSMALLLLPGLVVAIIVSGLGLGLALAALNVRYRDVRHVVPFLIQIWMFASPVVYPVSLVPEKWQSAYFLNPMAGAIEAFRHATIGTPAPSGASLGISATVAIVGLLAGAAVFESRAVTFADDV